MDISTEWPKSDIHTGIYPWISLSTASLHTTLLEAIFWPKPRTPVVH